EGSAAENRALSANLESVAQELAQIRSQYMDAEKKFASMESTLAHEQKAAAEKAKAFESMRDTMLESFTALSSRALKENNQSFMEIAKVTFTGYVENARKDFDHKKEAVKAFVAPLSEALIKYDQQVRSMEQAREKAYGGLSRQVADLAETQKSLQQETGKLVRALRLPQVRGRWGELTLRRVVEIAGMQNHCDFYEQQTSGTDSGAIRPDMIVKLPGNRQVVIDAKVSIIAYLDALEAEDGSQRDAKLDDHARQVRNHVNGLAKKAYWATFTPTPEFVVLFMPGENFFSAALERDPSLIEDSAEKGVILATPTTLISLLKTVSYAWRQELAAENAKKVSELGNELYTRLYAMVEHINRLGKDIDRCVNTYNKTVGSLERRVLVSARKFIDMGAASEDRKSLDKPAIVENKPRQMEADDEPVDG
ncbi:MAG: DNA recombination protein RmuC, partial [Deltaproteobacteria bacterium]|nr:DNA recombination protein RmuC [Deltaproteobacteria bacterium]